MKLNLNETRESRKLADNDGGKNVFVFFSGKGKVMQQFFPVRNRSKFYFTRLRHIKLKKIGRFKLLTCAFARIHYISFIELNLLFNKVVLSIDANCQK